MNWLRLFARYRVSGSADPKRAITAFNVPVVELRLGFGAAEGAINAGWNVQVTVDGPIAKFDLENPEALAVPRCGQGSGREWFASDVRNNRTGFRGRQIQRAPPQHHQHYDAGEVGS